MRSESGIAGHPKIGDIVGCSLSKLKAVCMFRSLVFVLVVAPFWCVLGDSLDRWNWRNPSPPLSALTAVAYGDGMFVAVGWSDGVLISSDGTNWLQQPTSLFDNTLYGVAYGNNRWVAVGQRGVIISSADGRCWERENSGTTQLLNAVSYGNGVFVAAGTDGTILTSSNGLAWEARSSGTSIDLRGVTCGGSNWVAVGGDISVFGPPDGYVLLTSRDGVSWTDRSARIPELYQSLHGVAYGNETFVVVGWTMQTDEGLTIFTSRDGIDWRQQNSGIYGWQYLDLTAITFANNTFLTAGRAGVLASPDGTNWFHRVAASLSFVGAAYGNNTWVIVHSAFVSSGHYQARIETSLDTTTWQRQRSGTSQPLFGIESTNDLAVAVGVDGTILSSSNGQRWKTEISGTTNALHAVAHGRDLWMAVGAEGTVLTSTNGRLWEAHSVGTNTWLFDVAYGNRTFIAVGNHGGVFSSQNGVAWETRSSGVSNHLRGVCYGADRWMAVGVEGIILTSTDGVNWTQGPTGLAAHLNEVKFLQGRWFAVGGTVVLVSSNSVDWSRQGLPFGGGLWDVTFGGGHFVITVRNSFPNSAYFFISEDGVSWTPRAVHSWTPMNAVVFARDSFIAVGDDGVILQSDPLGGTPTRLEGPFRNNGGSYDLVLRSERDTSFRLEATSDFATWDNLGTVSNDCCCASFRDYTATNHTRRYYRAVEVTP